MPQCSALAADPAFGLAGNPLIASATSTLVAATPTNAAFCNVQLTYSAIADTAYGYAPGEAQAIRIGIGLPINSSDGGVGGVQGAWNGKIQNLGGGGLVGSVGATTSATSDGYVGSSTDGGHTTAQNGARGNFGVIQASNQLNRGKIIDYIIESVHQQVEWSKLLALNYYNAKPTRNYWNGCSTGGRQGLALARYYGNEFDGFLVGAPAFFHDEFRFSDAWPWLMVKDLLVPKGQTLTTAQYTAASNAAIAACQSSERQRAWRTATSMIRVPAPSTPARICAADPARPRLRTASTADQAQAINMIWDGPRNHLGQKIWHPMERGSADRRRLCEHSGQRGAGPVVGSPGSHFQHESALLEPGSTCRGGVSGRVRSRTKTKRRSARSTPTTCWARTPISSAPSIWRRITAPRSSCGRGLRIS